MWNDHKGHFLSAHRCPEGRGKALCEKTAMDVSKTPLDDSLRKESEPEKLSRQKVIKMTI